MVTIIDYGMGNLQSVQKAFQAVGAQAEIVSHPEQVATAEVIVLPGVGAFGRAMQNLQQTGMDQAVREAIRAGKPFLGICLGFQLLFESSEEDEGETGLKILEGRVVGFKSKPGFTLPVPHIGWNRLRFGRLSPLWNGLKEGVHVYFVHSYFPEPDQSELVIATAEYGVEFPCTIAWENLYATQFHPEKSGTVGLRILENFCRLAFP